MESVDYGSEFEYDSEAGRKRASRNDLASRQKEAQSKLPSKQEVIQNYDQEEWKNQRFHLLSLTAKDAQQKMYVCDNCIKIEMDNDAAIQLLITSNHGTEADFKRDSSKDRTDADVIRENHRFLWTEDDSNEDTWEKRLAKKYHDKLFKEYCITDLSRYKDNKIALRWRIEKEVVDGTGQFTCGNKKCKLDEDLRSWEVNFSYEEHGEKKNALVKLRLCQDCSDKLNYHHRRREIKAEKRKAKQERSSSKRRKQEEGTTDLTDKESDHKEQVSSTEVTGSKSSEKNADNLWSEPAPPTEEKSREEEFDDYFEDMFL